MSDMFRNYDYVIEKPIKKAVAKNAYPAIAENLSTNWLYNIKGEVRGISCKANSDSTLYFSIEIGDPKVFEKLIDSNKIFCEFLDKSFTPVLIKQASYYYTGILKISIDSGELPIGNYYVRISAGEDSTTETDDAAITSLSLIDSLCCGSKAEQEDTEEDFENYILDKKYLLYSNPTFIISVQ